MKKLFFVLVIMGIAGTAKSQMQGGPVTVPGTLQGESDTPHKQIECKRSDEVCCTIWISRSAEAPNTVTIDQKTYTFKSYTTTTDDKGNSTLTFEDARPQ